MASVRRSGAPRRVPSDRFGLQVGVPVSGSMDAGWASRFRDAAAQRARGAKNAGDVSAFLSVLRVDGAQAGGAEIRFRVTDPSAATVSSYLDVIDRAIGDANSGQVWATPHGKIAASPKQPSATAVDATLRSWAARHPAH
jgi:hypothetical protein